MKLPGTLSMLFFDHSVTLMFLFPAKKQYAQVGARLPAFCLPWLLGAAGEGRGCPLLCASVFGALLPRWGFCGLQGLAAQSV